MLLKEGNMYNEKYSYFTDKLAEIIFRRTLDAQLLPPSLSGLDYLNRFRLF